MKKVLVGLGILLSLLVVVATALPTILHAAGCTPTTRARRLICPVKEP